MNDNLDNRDILPVRPADAASDTLYRIHSLNRDSRRSPKERFEDHLDKDKSKDKKRKPHDHRSAPRQRASPPIGQIPALLHPGEVHDDVTLAHDSQRLPVAPTADVLHGRREDYGEPVPTTARCRKAPGYSNSMGSDRRSSDSPTAEDPFATKRGDEGEPGEAPNVPEPLRESDPSAHNPPDSSPGKKINIVA